VAWWTIIVQHQMPDLAGRADIATIQPPIEEQPCADPRAAEVDIRDIAPSACGAPAMFGQRAQVGIVFEEHPQPQLALERGAQRYVVPARQPRQPYARPENRAGRDPGRRQCLVYQCDDPRDAGGRAGRHVERRSRALYDVRGKIGEQRRQCCRTEFDAKDEPRLVVERDHDRAPPTVRVAGTDLTHDLRGEQRRDNVRDRRAAQVAPPRELGARDRAILADQIEHNTLV
jgi:hypothetical protein